MGLSLKQDWGHGLLHSPSDDSGTGSSSMELPNPPIKRKEEEQERSLQPPTEKLKCPRCDSTNTKFCYYNNYNKSQPRHFCKACKRHWTKGGMLRNVPVGGGRKNKRLKTTAPKTSHSQVGIQDHSDQRLRLDFLGPQFLAQESLFNSSSNQTDFNFNSSIFGGSSISQSHDLQFPCPNFINLDTNPCGLGIGDSVAMNGPDRCSLNDKPWPLTEESTINWGWDEIDKFVTADITIPWDDAEII